MLCLPDYLGLKASIENNINFGDFLNHAESKYIYLCKDDPETGIEKNISFGDLLILAEGLGLASHTTFSLYL